MKVVIRTLAMLTPFLASVFSLPLPASSAERILSMYMVDLRGSGCGSGFNYRRERLACTVITASTTSTVPDNLRPPSNEKLSLTLLAKGVQIYQCQAKKDNTAEFEWLFKAPEADLFTQDNQKIGKHYAGPTWESNDGSLVMGEVKAKAEATEPNSIPWLLLSAKKIEGNGVFSKVTSIQRLDTVGGKAPTDNCNGKTVGQEIRVPYTATYNFYTAQP